MEAMAIEQLLLRRWELDGYFGQNRIRIPGKNNWKEIDAIAVYHNSEGTFLRVGEVKTRGNPNQIFPIDDYVYRYEKESDDTAEKWLGKWGKFVDSFCSLYNDLEDTSVLIGLPQWSELTGIQLWFVFNGWEIPGTEANRALENGIRSFAIKRWGYTQKNPATLRDLFSVTVVSTRDLILDTIKRMRVIIDNGRGARFGDPFLDSIREVLRYIRPEFYESPTVDRDDVPTKRRFEEQVKKETIELLLDAFGVK